MWQPFGGGQSAIDVAVAAIPLSMVIGAALYLNGQHRRYGRPTGWPGRLTLAALFVGLGLAAYAVWPLPTSADGLCPVVPEPAPPLDVRSALLVSVIFLPVGLLARARFRRGLLVTLGLGAVLATVVAGVRVTGVLGLYPCAYASGSPELLAIAVGAVALGWLLARWTPVLWPLGPRRSWPGAVPDLADPGLARRGLGVLFDLGLWWFGGALIVALLHAYGVIRPGAEEQVRAATLLALALGLTIVTPLCRRDRCTPGRAALRLALSERFRPLPAARGRVLARALLLQMPVAVLIVMGSGWWALGVLLVHVSAALVRPDRTGAVDLLCGTGVRTRASIDGDLPRRLVRYSPPPTPVPS